MEVPLAGRLLVAGPRLVDPNFTRTVVFVCRHDEEGALGLVLNRPTSIAVADALPDWVASLAPPHVVFLGGPVQPDMAVALARLAPAGAPRPGDNAWTPIDDRLGLLDLGSSPTDAGAALDRLRVYAGYAGWGPGQLDFEVIQGDWWVLDAAPDDLFTSAPGGLRRRVLRRQPGPLSLFADFPPDPSFN